MTLRDREARDILVFGGGAIPDEDIPNLPASGIQAIFTPGTSTREAITGV
jgi:methylmalonyl-CoA mutase C-terminal domain/subunit